MSDIIVNTHEAKTNLSKLLQIVEDGQEVIIARAGKPIGLLSKFIEKKPEKLAKRKFGGLENTLVLNNEWENTPQDIIDAAWNNPLIPTENVPSK